MPDRTDRTPSTPPDWSSAFAQLPPETPPADGWSRIAATLARRGVLTAADGTPADEPIRLHPSNDPVQVEPRRPAANARPRQRQGQRWMMAAMLAAALPLGLWLSLRDHSPSRTDAGADAVAHSVAAPAAAQPTTAKQAPDAVADSRHGAEPAALAIADASEPDPSSSEIPATAITPAPAPSPTTDRIAATPAPRRVQGRPMRSPTPDSAAPDSTASQLAAIPPEVTAPASPDTASTAATALASIDDEAGLLRELGDLQAESAQLEALVAATRDEQVGSAAATVMSSELDERVRLIDATLTAGSLPAAQRLALWQQRVGALRTLAGVESTQRWFAARGERYDDALVRVD
ncbi:hypothetical protein [Lysobacter sp. 1R34A]|uniref:hypothetical protein n=1 Tax=Lysobacter sp. 1R34A TaxID=3445786 RepID=UPI003EED2C2E